MSDHPTPKEVLAHIKSGGHIQRRGTPNGVWIASWDAPQIKDRSWTEMEDKPLVNYRLVL